MDFISLSDDLQRIGNSLKSHARALNDTVKALRAFHPTKEAMSPHLSESLDSFFTKKCVVQTDSIEKATDLYELFKAWCETAGLENPYLSQRSFGQVVGKIFTRCRRNGLVYYRGLKIRGN